MTTDFLLNQQVERVLGCLMPCNRLVIECIIQTGLRVSDVLAFKTADLRKGLQWWITEGKTGKRRRVNLNRRLWNDLIDQAGEVWVFEHRTDPAKHRSRGTVWADVKRASKAYRLPQNVGTHSFRKVYAVDLMRKYGDSDRVRRALNHSSMEVTVIYMAADVLLQEKLRRRRGRSIPA